jgi:iron(III) transport system ATP-binding protein
MRSLAAARGRAVAGVDAASLSKHFGRLAAVDGVDVSIQDGEFVALLGPSGCGKTTLLRLVAGFETPDGGELKLGGIPVARPGWALPPEDRNIGMVFQSYALWPHMNVAENVGFALTVRRSTAEQRKRRVAEALELVGMAGFEARRPGDLSGGQRQRVALARCLAMRPGIVLLDEPLANLDAHLREAMQSEFRRFHRQIGATFIYVTHDQAEAMALADRIAVIDRGRIQQIAEPERLYRQPETEMVAGFIGAGMVVKAEVVGEENGALVVNALGTRFQARGTGRGGQKRLLCLRPGDLRLVDGASPGFPAHLTESRFQGATTLMTVRPATASPDCPELRIEHRGPAPAVGTTVRVSVDDAWVIPAAGA